MTLAGRATGRRHPARTGSLEAEHIGVTVDNGVVTLTGHVGSYAEKTMTERVVQHIKGVRAIAQDIEVRFPEDKKTADDEIAGRAAKIIAWNVAIPDGKVHINVQRGCVTLSGQVDWHFQALQRKKRCANSGVSGVNNMLSIRPRIDIASIKNSIETALTRNAEIEADGINVDVSGGKVTLNGKVNTWRERTTAESAAWSVPGVTAVEGRLVVV
ncbi:BON domain-containing protein [Pararhizobium sp. A13]|uniref:BON domain-containing protein n=1 Tax=Pararhizobium sp. A13 TaxID=3133975 RepID=UPI00311B0DA9